MTTAATPSDRPAPSEPSVPPIGLIWAQAEGGVIGRDGAMPWHVPEDLAHFKAMTLGDGPVGDPVVMGRKTWDSLTPRFRPLPGRRNIVITGQHDWVAGGADVANSLPAALALAAQPSSSAVSAVQPSSLAAPPAVSAAQPSSAALAPGDTVPDRIWVIGGGRVFRESIALADRLEVTEINGRYEGDSFAPPVGEDWLAVDVVPASGWLTSRTGIQYRFLRYARP